MEDWLTLGLVKTKWPTHYSMQIAVSMIWFDLYARYKIKSNKDDIKDNVKMAVTISTATIYSMWVQQTFELIWVQSKYTNKMQTHNQSGSRITEGQSSSKYLDVSTTKWAMFVDR